MGGSGGAQLSQGQYNWNGGVDPTSGATQAGQGMGNPTSNNFDQNNLQSIGSLVGGSPTSNQVLGNMAYLQGPNQANYKINGLDDYQNQQAGFRNDNLTLFNEQRASPLLTQGQDQQMQSYNALQQMAQGNGPSLARANLQAGLNQQNAALQSQAMSSAGGAGMGNSQRNLLNAQAAAGTNMQNQAQQASVAEQMGALQQQSAAANAYRNSAMAQQGINAQTNQQFLNNQMNSYNAGFGANLAQTQANMGYDAAVQGYGRDRANVGLQATNSGAQASRDAAGFFGNIINGGAAALAGSDENMKTDIADDDGDDSQILGFLRSFAGNQDKQAQAPTYNLHAPAQSSSGIMGGGIMPKGGFVSQDNASNGLNNFVKGNSGANQNPQSGLGVFTKPVGGEWDENAGDAGTTAGKSSGKGGGKSGGAGGMLGGLLGGKSEGSEGGGGMLGGLFGGGGSGGESSGAMSGVSEALPQIFSMLGSIVSDERKKKDVKGSDKDNQQFMDKLESKSFRYKDPDKPYTAKGRVHGVMAQDMEKSKVGKDMVYDTPIGKLFNMPKAVSATLSSLATLNKRMDKFEKKAG